MWEAWKQVCKLKLYAEMPLWFCRMAEEMSFEEMEMFRGKHDDSAWFVLEGPTLEMSALIQDTLGKVRQVAYQFSVGQ